MKVNFSVMLYDGASGPILQMVSTAASFRDLCIPSLKAESLQVFLKV